MKVSMVDFRSKSKEIICSIKRKEDIEVFYHKKRIAILKPVSNKDIIKKDLSKLSFFGSKKNDIEAVDKIMDKLRKEKRYDF